MKLSYDLYNAPCDLPPIIFLHGLGDWRQTWKIVAPEIAKRTNRQAYAMDARNHGNSPRSAALDYDMLTKDLVDFMDDLRIKSAVIVGHSMGGRTAITFALKYPHRTESLIVEDMTPKNIDSGPGSFVMQAVRVGFELLTGLPADMDLETGRQHLLDLFLSILGERFVKDGTKLKTMIDPSMIPITKDGEKFSVVGNFDSILTMLEKNALVQNLPESGLTFSGDTLFLYGSQAFYNLGKDDSIKKLFPRSILKKIIGSTHYIHVDNPDTFAQEVSDFINASKMPKSKC